MLWGPVEVSRGAAANFERPPVPAMAVWVDDERRAPARRGVEWGIALQQ